MNAPQVLPVSPRVGVWGTHSLKVSSNGDPPPLVHTLEIQNAVTHSVYITPLVTKPDLLGYR